MSSHVVVFGGSFNPPHVGHEMLLLSVDTMKCFRKIVAMPCYKSLYEKQLVPFEHRVAMTKLMLEGRGDDFSQFIVSDWEKDNQDLKGTINFMDRMIEQKLFGDDQHYFVMGQDNAENIQKWVRWEELIRKHRFIVVRRNGIKPKLDWYFNAPHIIMSMGDNYKDISSTKFREYMAAGNEEMAKKYVKPNVFQYIKDNKLFINTTTG